MKKSSSAKTLTDNLVIVLHDNTLTMFGGEIDHQEISYKRSRDGVMVTEITGFKRWFSDDDLKEDFFEVLSHLK